MEWLITPAPHLRIVSDELFSAAERELREEKHHIGAELKRLVDMIVAGTASSTVMSAITERKARIRVITDKLVEPRPGSLQERLDEIRTLAVERLAQLRGLLTKPSAIHGKFTPRESQQGGKITFKAKGKIDFFGENRRTAGVVGRPGAGAEVAVQTPEFAASFSVSATARIESLETSSSDGELAKRDTSP